MNTIAPQVFATLAWYNRRANERFGDLLAGHPNLVLEPKTTHFGSILDLLAHIALSDAVWLRRIWPEGRARPEAIGLVRTSASEPLFADLDAWRPHRAALDGAFEEVCGGFDEAALAREVRYTTAAGVEQAHALWEVLLQVLNHQTHHRGGIAQLLDERGIENDLSNIISYLRERPA